MSRSFSSSRYYYWINVWQKRTLGLRVKSTPQDEPGLTKRPRFSSERRSQKNMVEEIVAAYDRENEVCQTPDELKSEVTLEEKLKLILRKGCVVLLREVEVQCSLLPSPEEDILAPKPVEDDTAELVLFILSFFSSDTEGRKTVVEEDKFIVFGTCLLSLFTVCMQCFHASIVKVWETTQHALVSRLMELEKPLVLGGDARADSPGHTAKFGSYTLMELNVNQILDLTLIQKNEVSSSNAMELEGFKRTMKWMIETAMMADLEIDCISQIGICKLQSGFGKIYHATILSTTMMSGILQSVSTNLINRAIKKKIIALGKKKRCDAVNEWCKSIINHLHWSAASTLM
ncbi:hypothetical protein BSL78_22446 [Apostichopus japonicus]|uniref:Uncharacterized protein n=1 Tax=Stichopus japonicus TaxID=307972 RepID=A0A2G8JY35_STIJA|nr:hypothetical protein BSL78_22446 [Apostichopus japonicus]